MPTKHPKRSPSFVGLRPVSARSSAAAKASSRKANTGCELALRRALWARGIRYRLAVKNLAGKPDLVFRRGRLVVFCDGDFWHGRDLEARLHRLANGHNASYWVEKIRGNVERDRRHDTTLRAAGWQVMRLWETDILGDPAAAAEAVLRQLAR